MIRSSKPHSGTSVKYAKFYLPLNNFWANEVFLKKIMDYVQMFHLIEH